MFKRFSLLLLGALCVLCAFSCTALAATKAATKAPGWETTARTYPTNLPPGGTGTVVIDLYNVGAAPSSGMVTVTDELPHGVTATEAGGYDLDEINGLTEERPTSVPGAFGGPRWSCSGTTVVTCINNLAYLPAVPPGDPSYEVERLGIAVKVEPGVEGVFSNRVTVAGGGAASSASSADPVTLSASAPSVGFAGWDVWYSNANGTPDTQAGSHPYEATFSLDMNTLADGHPVDGSVRNLEVTLPPGLVGDPNAVPQCTRQQLDAESCPAVTQIGIIQVGLEGDPKPDDYSRFPVYNMVPPPGVPDEMAFSIIGKHAFFDAGVSNGGGDPITDHVDNIPQLGVVYTSLSLWGVPAEASHDPDRNARGDGDNLSCPGGCSSGAIPKPFLTLPTSCGAPQATTIRELGSWENPDSTAETSVLSHDNNGVPVGFSGCEDLVFGPSITAAPDTTGADTPAGLTVEVKPIVGGLEETEGLSAADIQDTTVTLPEGLVINPGQAAGLKACQESEAALGTENAASCPTASKVGEVKIKTPLLEGALEKELEGNVYVMQSNPPEVKLLIAASADGVNLKLVGIVHLNETTGRLVTTFEGTPELPFTDFKLSFSGGAQAALATPTQCGTYTTTSDFTPWSSPFLADAFPTSTFAITSGVGGGSCPSSPLPFSPSLIAGATTDQAGGFTDFSLLLRRGDGQQRIEKLQFKAPAGLIGMISSVPLCGEPQAAEGTCSASSQIGHTVVQSGPGPFPLVLPEPGNPPAPIYLTGPYKGAPFGLSIVTPVIAGPFNLGTIVTRASIAVDPHTAQIVVTTDPLPQVVKGVPADLRTIDAVIDRAGFMINPTNCDPQAFSGTVTSYQGTLAAISSPFQVGSCRSLGFSPSFTAIASGRNSKANGASLSATLSYPNTPAGTGQATSQANIARVKVELPRQLPSRLTTLQKACTAEVFNANPAGCPSASIVGTAVVHTPVLPVALTGPAYFVSHGGEAFPSLIVVLQGDGVTVQVEATTFISKAGVTSLTFKSAPDAPFTSFTLTSPQGPYSALTALGNLCAPTTTKSVKKRITIHTHGHTKHITKTIKTIVPETLMMPTELVAQNGAVIHQNTRVNVTGCPKAKPAVKKKSKPKTKKKGAKHE